MSLHLFVKKKYYSLRLSTILLKKALLFFNNQKNHTSFSKKHTIYTFFSKPTFFLKKPTFLFSTLTFPFSNFFKENFFTNYTLFGTYFFSLDNTYKLNFTITFTKRNFFISIGSNIKWRFFIKPDNSQSDENVSDSAPDHAVPSPSLVTEVEEPTMIVNFAETVFNTDRLYSINSTRRMYINATVSAGSTNLEDKSKRLRFSNYAIGKDLSVLIVSIFWTSIHKLDIPLFSISIKFKGRIKWSRSIIASVWKSINKLYWEHQSYLLRHRHVTLKKEDGDSLKYEHSLARLKMIEGCPLFFELLTSVKSIPHNGCKMKKIARLRRNR